MDLTRQAKGVTVALNPWLQWVPVGIGLCLLYVPTYVRLWNGVWQSEEQGHGPLILAVIAWLLWERRTAFVEGDPRPQSALGWAVLLVGLLSYVVGRSQDILILEVGSHIAVIAGSILIVRGTKLLKTVWFPIVFFVFMVPLPGILVDALTGPLKRHVSEVAEHLLYLAGYPIARSGVTLTIGQYQLLVADACSGLHSLYSLLALGLLFLYLTRRSSWLQTAVIGLAILPIAFAANVVRVILLVLITYYFGDEVGQGFIHGFTGIVLFVAALILLFGIDAMLGLVVRRGLPFRRRATQA